MTLKDAIEKEILSQGISAIDISKVSGVSKATIYNILNGLTDDPRIRPSTKRAIARGCGKDLRILGDGGVEFFNPGAEGEVSSLPPASLRLALLPGRPFLSDSFCREAFDWLHGLEASGRIPSCGVVDRVFQRRPGFLSLVIDAPGPLEISTVTCALDVSIPGSRVQKSISIRGIAPAVLDRKPEVTLFVQDATFDFEVEVSKVSLRDADGGACAAAWENESMAVYRFRAPDPGAS